MAVQLAWLWIVMAALGPAQERPVQSARQTSDPVTTYSTQRLPGTVYLLNAQRGPASVNAVFSVGPDGILLVDTLTEPLSRGLHREIARTSASQVRYVINTHFHGDHVGGNRYFGEHAIIIAHPNVRSRISKEQNLPWEAQPVPPEPEVARPEITLSESSSVYFNGEEIRLVPMPRSHTDSDLVVIFAGSKVVCLGDVIYFVAGKLMPSASAFSGGSLPNLMSTLGVLLTQIPPDAQIVPGHGPLLTPSDLEQYRTLIDAVLAYVAHQKRTGKDTEAIKKAGLPAQITAIVRWPIADAAWIQAAAAAIEE